MDQPQKLESLGERDRNAAVEELVTLRLKPIAAKVTALLVAQEPSEAERILQSPSSFLNTVQQAVAVLLNRGMMTQCPPSRQQACIKIEEEDDEEGRHDLAMIW